ncbi:hypothetical protein AB1046_04280 [Promicromonospora sp. Populi]|uniref:DUF7878 domain-containing protein n=1 Tax=Promicromonospora sp. Populi TaxID=3239420 RepID=UPI0034E1C08E
MQLVYANFDDSDLRGRTLADYLIAIDADFEIRDQDRTVYNEPKFPVVELARALIAWLEADFHADFVFESLSSDEPGLVAITRENSGWRFSSASTPEVVSAEVDQLDVQSCIRDFIDRVATDLTARGHDADTILRGRDGVSP